MSTSISLFCEHCGAANEMQATACCFCGNPLEAPSTTGYDANGCLLADTMLKGRYRIVKVIGQGGMGTVYRALDTELEYRAVAVKELVVRDLNAQQTQEAIEAFKREATLLAALQHANLPTVYEHFEENGRWYMVMSFIPGETLEDYLQRTNRNKLPLPEVLQIGKQLCTALHYLHSQVPPIIFRDVKPANIMRAPDGQIYLIDFGVARRFKPDQKKDTIPFGSIGYAPPEQFGKAQTTPRSDIYSLGATLHQLLSGHESDSTPLHLPPLQTLEPTLPKELDALIELMLEMDAKKRPANMLIVEQKLQEISTSAVYQPFALPKPAKQRKQTSPFIQGMVFLGICCLVIGGFIGGGIGNTTASAANQAHMQATAIANNLSQAHAAATATVVIDALQRLIAAQPNPYGVKGTLALVDPLSQPGAWQPESDTSFGGTCQFQDGAYQITQSPTDSFFICTENTLFKNFIFQVNMTIATGDCGGMLFRENASDSSKFYKFKVCDDGSYGLYRYASYSDSDLSTLKEGTDLLLIHIEQENTIAVVANGSTFDLYLNNQKIVSITDNTYSIGTLGLMADAIQNNTTVNYQDAIIWALP